MLDLWLARCDRLFTTINIVLMGTMTAMVTVAVILRYVFSISFAWSEEAIAMIFVMSSLLGSVSVARRGDHIAHRLHLRLGIAARGALAAHRRSRLR